VLAGLKPGEPVVTSGAFLLNAESQFQSVLTKMLPPEGGEEPGLERLLGEALSEDLRTVLKAYFALSDALAKDAVQPVPERARALAEAAGALAKRAEGEDKAELARTAERVKGAAEASPLRLASDLGEARRGFGQVSKALTGLLADQGGAAMLGEDLFAFECPMAGKFGYKRWLQGTAEMENPYMGQKMLKCGQQLESLQP
jgi:Cu(I)/Ag(I) efflux system membrane fusion protein